MSDIIVNGTIVQALPIQQGVSQRTGNTWQRASYLIEHEHGQYPKRMVFDVSNAKIQELNLQVGEEVSLHLNVSCREYPEGSGKYFNSIEAWKAERQGQQQVQQPQYQQQMPPQQFPQQVNQQGQPVQQPMPGAAPFPPQQPSQQQPQQGGQQGKLPF